jgi:hypothetical protein
MPLRREQEHASQALNAVACRAWFTGLFGEMDAPEYYKKTGLADFTMGCLAFLFDKSGPQEGPYNWIGTAAWSSSLSRSLEMFPELRDAAAPSPWLLKWWSSKIFEGMSKRGIRFCF